MGEMHLFVFVQEKTRNNKTKGSYDMKIKRTKILSLILIVCLCISILPTMAFAANETRTGLTLHTGSGSSTQIVTVGQEVSLPLPTRAGYIFDGWYKDQECTDGNGPMMKILIENQTELWAKWVSEENADTVTKYTLNFNTGGGEAIESVDTTYGVTVALETYNPAKDGYIFTDWFADKELSNRITSVMMTEDTTVYAGWMALEDGEARYQQQADGEWIVDTFAKACARVYDGGTIEVLKDVEISTPISIRKTLTITSADAAQGPHTLKRAGNFTPINTNESLLNIYYKGSWGTDTFDSDITLYLDHIYVDGGSEDGITTTDDLISVSYANLVLGEETSIQNNKNEGARSGGIGSFGGNITVGKGSQIVNCESCLGGGIFADGGTVKITGGKIERNTATTDSRTDFIVKLNEQKCGAGIFAWSRDDLPDVVIEFESGSISNNTAGNYGAGIYLKANEGKTATIKMTGGIIEENTAKYGAGVYVLSGQLAMSGGSIIGNTATVYGGGVYYAPLDEHVVYLSGCPKIMGNTSSGNEDNIYMDSLQNDQDITRTIVLTGALTQEAVVGITRWKTPTDDAPEKIVAEPSADPSYSITENDLEKFYSDDLTYTLKMQDGNIVMTTAVRVGGLMVSPTELTMKVGGTSTLTATVTPEDASNKAVKWTSSDESIATVDENGVVTAKSVGKATITAETVDGGHTAACRVTVKAANSGGTTTYYTLTFETNGGSKVEDIRRSSGSIITLNQTTEREGYVFTGWFIDKELSQNTESIVLTKNTTVYAGWQKDVAEPADTGVSDWLNTRDHMEYLQGYPKSMFGADNDMTRAEAAQMFYNLLLSKDISITVSFDDVEDTAWYAKAVDTLASVGIIKGVGDNKFMPERSITRAEFVAMAMRFAKLDTSGENIFSDVLENEWYYDYIVGSIKYGWITGYSDDTFEPNNTITRAEVTAIVNRILGRNADKGYINTHSDRLVKFEDLAKSHWAYYDIVEATNAHDYTKTNGVEHWD